MDDKLFEAADDESDATDETRGYLAQRERSNPIRCASPCFLFAGGENNSPIGGR
jgi:hypothetical protein